MGVLYNDYVAIFKNLGSTTDLLGDGVAFDSKVGAYLTTGVGGTATKGNFQPYWTISPGRNNSTWYFTTSYWNSINQPAELKNIRPLMVFGGTEATTSYSLEEEVVKVGMIVGSDGRAYTADSKDYLPSGITAAGMLAYKKGGTRLIIALTDEASSKSWDDAQTTASAHSPAVPGQNWKLPSIDEWKQMLSANGGDEKSYNGLNAAITAAGGTALQEGRDYWLSTENGSNACSVSFSSGKAGFNGGDAKSNQCQVRVCYTFAIGYNQLSNATANDIGKVVCEAGHLHKAKAHVPEGCTAVGILSRVTSTGHGLILALQDAPDQWWRTINGWTSVTAYAGTTLKLVPDDAARGPLKSYTALGGITVSNWCVAQKSDYEAIFKNLGSTKSDDNGTVFDDNVNAYLTTGVGGQPFKAFYCSATASHEKDKAWKLCNYWISFFQDNEKFRPVLGF